MESLRENLFLQPNLTDSMRRFRRVTEAIRDLFKATGLAKEMENGKITQ